MPSLSLAALARCGVEMDLVTSFFAGMGLSDRSREGVMLPELCWTHGAAECMNLRYISRPSEGGSVAHTHTRPLCRYEYFVAMDIQSALLFQSRGAWRRRELLAVGRQAAGTKE